jgi:DNA modification methylase
MNTIPISEIRISPDRQRQEFDADSLMELTNSIATIGLIHAPVLRATSDGLILVAGERRLRAIEDLFMLGHKLIYNEVEIPSGSVPYTTLGELSFLEAEEAELDENLKRRDLTWQELAAAHERLHKLRQAQMELAQQSDESLPDHTVADTAQELCGRSDGAYQDKVRRELIVAKHLDKPEIKAAKTVDEAFKLLKAQENRERNIALAEETGKTFSSAIHQLHNIDCLDWMTAYADGMPDYPGSGIDVILTDPPYGMGADSFGNAAGKLSGIEHHYDDSYESWLYLMEAWCPLSYAICKPQAHAYVFCDIDNFPALRTLMQQAGWYVFRTPFICIKPNSGRVPLPDQGPRRQYETLLYAIKGKKPVTHIYPDVISTAADDQLSHGAQKPVALFKNLLQRSVRPGDVVLDCFAGTGPIIPAAHHFQCKAIVLEKEKAEYAVCCQRLKELEAGE